MAEQRLIGLWTDCFNIVIDLLETSCYLFSNFEFMIWFFFYIPLMPRGHFLLLLGPKEGSKKRAWESLICPLRSQNAIPAPYTQLLQKGPDNCDTVGISSGPF